MREECINLQQQYQQMKNGMKQNEDIPMENSSSEEPVDNLNISSMEIHDEDDGNHNKVKEDNYGGVDKGDEFNDVDRGDDSLCDDRGDNYSDVDGDAVYGVDRRDNFSDVERGENNGCVDRGATFGDVEKENNFGIDKEDTNVNMMETIDELSDISTVSKLSESRIPQLLKQRAVKEQARPTKESEYHRSRNVTKSGILEPPLIARPLYRPATSVQHTSTLLQTVPHPAPQSRNQFHVNISKWNTPVVSQPSTCTKAVIPQLISPRNQNDDGPQPPQVFSLQFSQGQSSSSLKSGGNKGQLLYSSKSVPKLQLSVERLSCQTEDRYKPSVRNTPTIQPNDKRQQSEHVIQIDQGMRRPSTRPIITEYDSYIDHKPTEQSIVAKQQKSTLDVPTFHQLVPKHQQPSTAQQSARKVCPTLPQPPTSLFKESKPAQDALAKQYSASIQHTNFKKCHSVSVPAVQVQKPVQPQLEVDKVVKTIPIMQQVQGSVVQDDSKVVPSPENVMNNETLPVSICTVQDQPTDQSLDESKSLSEMKIGHPESSSEKVQDEKESDDEPCQEEMNQTTDSMTYFLPMKECSDDQSAEDKLSQESSKSPINLVRRRKHLEDLFSKSPGLPDNYLAPLKRPFVKGGESQQKQKNADFPAFGMSHVQDTSIFSSGDADSSVKSMGNMLHKSGIQENHSMEEMFGIHESTDGSKENSFAFFDQNKQTTDRDSFSFNFGNDSQTDKQETSFSSMFDFGKISNSPQQESVFKMSIFDQNNDSQLNDCKFSFNFGQNSPVGSKQSTDNNNIMSLFGGESDNNNNKDGFFMLNFGSDNNDSPAAKPFSFF
ncbi:hypothetical protein ACF0H5_012791 [Mactra antiquata]